MKAKNVLGGHGLVIDVENPEFEARRWRRALALPVLRRNRREVVLGGPAFFVVLRRAKGRAAVAEIHVAVKEISGVSRTTDALGGRSAAADLDGTRLIVRQIVAPPSPAWRPRTKKRRLR